MRPYRVGLLAKEVTGGVGTVIKSILNFNSKEILYFGFLLKKDKHSLNLNNRNVTILNQDIDRNPSGSFISKFILFVKSIFKLNKIVKKHKTDLLILFDFYSYILGGFYKVLINPRMNNILYINVPIDKYLSLKPFISRNILLYAFKLSLFTIDGIIFMSKGLKRDFNSTFPSKQKINSIVIYQSVSQIKPINFKKHFVSSKKFTILSYGRFDKQKDFETIIKSYKLLNRSIYSKTALLIVGEGQKKHDYEVVVNSDPNIKIIPWRNDIYQLLKKCHLFIFSSNFEGFGIAILEALNCGIPILASDTQYGPSEILDKGKYGKLFPVNNTLALKNLITSCFRDRQMLERYSILGKTRSKYFLPNKQKHELREFIVQILKSRE